MPTYEQSRTYSIAFSLDEPLLRACEKLLIDNLDPFDPKRHTDKGPVSYSVRLGAGQQFSSKNLHDILQLANSGQRRIRSLLISTALLRTPSATIAFTVNDYGNTVSYTVRGDDQKTIFFLASQVEEFIVRTRCWYTRIAFTDAILLILGGLLLVTVGAFAYNVLVPKSGTVPAANDSAAFATGLLGIGALFLLGIILNKLRRWLFPPGLFAIGDGIKAVERLRFWRTTIGISILLAAAVNIATSLLF